MTDDTRPFVNNATMAEKHEIAKNDQRVHRDTNFSRAEGEFSLAQSGRHAQRVNITGQWDSLARYPKLPATSPWSCDPVPPEEPLGYSVEETPIVGEPHEQQLGDGASATPPSPVAVERAITSRPRDVEASTATPNPESNSNPNRRRGLR
jgi:hypothetical protein